MRQRPPCALLAGWAIRCWRSTATPGRCTSRGSRHHDTLQIDLSRHGTQASLAVCSADRFAGIVVTNYLHRPLFPDTVRSLAPGGVLIYETFAPATSSFGKPSNPDFPAAAGRTAGSCSACNAAALHVLAFEDGYIEHAEAGDGAAHLRSAQRQTVAVARISSVCIEHDASPDMPIEAGYPLQSIFYYLSAITSS